jgi:hypothetical protein
MNGLAREVNFPEGIVDTSPTNERTLIMLHQQIEQGRQTISQALGDQLSETMDEADRSKITDLLRLLPFL